MLRLLSRVGGPISELSMGPFRVTQPNPWTTLAYIGLRSSDQIITVALAYALILSRIMYAFPAWGGFLSAALIDKINAFLSA